MTVVYSHAILLLSLDVLEDNMAKEKIVQYFGYGALSQLGVIAAVTDNSNLVGRPAVLKGFALCVQGLGKIPDFISLISPVQISPRALLQESWPETFESYTIKPGNENDEVMGTIWELTPEERAMVREWELVEFGWYEDILATAVTLDSEEVGVETEGLRAGQEVDRCVDGKNYDPFLQPLVDYQKVAEKARREYDARQ